MACLIDWGNTIMWMLPRCMQVNQSYKSSLCDKILEALSDGNTKRAPLLASTLKTTAPQDSCNQASHTASQLILAIRNMAYQPKELIISLRLSLTLCMLWCVYDVIGWVPSSFPLTENTRIHCLEGWSLA